VLQVAQELNHKLKEDSSRQVVVQQTAQLASLEKSVQQAHESLRAWHLQGKQEALASEGQVPATSVDVTNGGAQLKTNTQGGTHEAVASNSSAAVDGSVISIACFSEVISNLEGPFRAYFEEVEQLVGQLAERSQPNRVAGKEGDSLEGPLEEQQDSQKGQRLEHTAKAQQQTNAQSQGTERLQAEVAAKEAQILDLQEELASKDERIKDFEAGVGARNTQISELQAGLAAAEAGVLALQAELSQKEEQFSRFEADVLTQKGTITKLEEDLSSANSHVASLQADVTTRDERVASLLEELQALQGASAAFDLERAKASERAESRVQALAAELDCAREATLAAERVARDFKQIAAELELTARDTERKLAEVEGQCLQQGELIQALQMQLATADNRGSDEERADQKDVLAGEVLTRDESGLGMAEQGPEGRQGQMVQGEQQEETETDRTALANPIEDLARGRGSREEEEVRSIATDVDLEGGAERAGEESVVAEIESLAHQVQGEPIPVKEEAVDADEQLRTDSTVAEGAETDFERQADQIAELQRELSNQADLFEARAEAMAHEFAGIQRELQAALAAAEERATALAQDNERFAIEMQDNSLERDRLSEALQALEAENAQLREAAGAFEGRGAEMRAQWRGREEGMSALEARVQGLERACECAQADAERMEAGWRDASVRAERLEETVLKLKRDLYEREAQLREALATAETLEKATREGAVETARRVRGAEAEVQQAETGIASGEERSGGAAGMRVQDGELVSREDSRRTSESQPGAEETLSVALAELVGGLGLPTTDSEQRASQRLLEALGVSSTESSPSGASTPQDDRASETWDAPRGALNAAHGRTVFVPATFSPTKLISQDSLDVPGKTLGLATGLGDTQVSLFPPTCGEEVEFVSPVGHKHGVETVGDQVDPSEGREVEVLDSGSPLWSGVPSSSQLQEVPTR
jgi:hypothetical protein